MCEVGEAFRQSNSESYEQARNFRFNFAAGVRDRSFAAKLEWLGGVLELRYSALVSLAFAVGVGATTFKAKLSRLERNSSTLELLNISRNVARWRNLGSNSGSVNDRQRTAYRIIPVFLKAKVALKMAGKVRKVWWFVGIHLDEVDGSVGTRFVEAFASSAVADLR